MKSPIGKIGIVLITAVVLPTIIFLAFQLSTYSESERTIEQTYEKYIDIVLFSINQYSQLSAEEMQKRLDKFLAKTQLPLEEKGKVEITNYLKENDAISSLLLTDLKQTKKEAFLSDHSALESILRLNNTKINRLETYKKGGFYKIEPFLNEAKSNMIYWVFLSNDKDSNSVVCAAEINAEIFIRQVVDFNIDKLANDEFHMDVINSTSGKVIFGDSTHKASEKSQRKDLWLLPGYSIGISLSGESIQGLVKGRSFVNLIFIVIVFVTLITGAIFVFVYTQKEVKLAQIKTDFVSNVSHELRTPLALISMFAETLEMDRIKSEEKKKEYYTIISQETQRLSRIVNKILNFSKMEAGKRVYNFELTDLNEVIQPLITAYSFHLKKNGFNIKVSLSDEVPMVMGDAEAISEAVVNLIDNAMKYSEEAKEIEITTFTEDEFAVISIKDKGIGISEENKHKIFDKFFRVTSGLVHNTKGTGLGLPIVKHIIEAHKGHITVDSIMWEGSTFMIKIPIPNFNSEV